VPEVVLGDGVGVLGDALHCRCAGDPQDRSKLALNKLRQLLGGKSGGAAINGAADETGQQNLALGSPAGKQRRVPSGFRI